VRRTLKTERRPTDVPNRVCGELTLELQHEDIPESVRAKAIEHILDGYGLALSGRDEEAHTIMLRYADRVSCAEEVHVLGTAIRSSAEVAALVEGSRRIHLPNGQENVNVRTIDGAGALT
jgi:2-methylcitrate dehydratase MmgE/PrpD-like protein